MKVLKTFFVVMFLMVGCQSKKAQEDKIAFSDKHINFQKWNRSNECCTASGKKIAIASGGTHSSQCGTEVYEKGGNLVDASVAVAFCLAVERPHSAGLGGGGFLTLHLAKQNKDIFVDFRETAPHLASRDMYLDRKGAVIPKLSLDGALSVATPGFVAGYYEIQKKWGKLEDWAQVLAPAIRLASQGFEVYPSLSERIESRKEVLLKDEQLSKIFLPDGKPLKPGTRLIQADLARTLELIARQGSDVFYRGEIARDISKRVQKGGGILAMEDLTHYKVQYREPLKGSYRGVDFVTAPPPSAGGVVLLEVFNVLNHFPFSPETAYSRYLHILSEAMKRGFADRSQFIGDPDHYRSQKYLALLKPDYAEALARTINPVKASPSAKIRPGEFLPAEFLKEEHPETTQLSLMDSDGDAVSSTITINYTFGSGMSVRGIVLNDEMDDFSAKPGQANVYGLTGSKANQIEPGKRPVSSMTPTIAVQNGRAVLAIGAPGGSHIISGVTQVILNQLIFYPGDLRRSVFAPRVHDQWIPDKLFMELAGFPEITQQKLKEMGHVLEQPPFTSLVAAVAWDPKKGEYVGVFDPRDEGGAEAR